MKIALVGGTHGNEPTGIEVMSLFRLSKKNFLNDYQCFWGNPKAFEEKKRYLDSDLNRAFGKSSQAKGYEARRAQELEREIRDTFDFCIDLHTTTSNMGMTAILNNTHPTSQKAARFLKIEFPDIKLIEEDHLNDDCVHLNRLCPGGLTIEVGPVANNVVSGELVLKTYAIVEKLLDFNFDFEVDETPIEVFKVDGVYNYPEKGSWYIHPKLEGADFTPMERGFPLFININRDVIEFDRDGTFYPFFINEAAYLEHRSAFLLAKKTDHFTSAKRI